MQLTKRMAGGILHYWGRIRKAIHFPSHPMLFYFYLTGRCNLSCTYCWQRSDGGLNHPVDDGWLDSTQEELKPEEWIQVVERLPRLSAIGLSGGEPTLSAACHPICLTAAKRGLPVTINTNGARIRNDFRSALMCGSVRNVSISLDGFATVHDRNRCQDGLFEQTVDTIDQINRIRQDHPFHLSIKTVFTEELGEDLLRFHAFCCDRLKADTLNISLPKTGEHAQFSLICTDDLSRVLASSCHLVPFHAPEATSRILGGLIESARCSRCQVEFFPSFKSPGQIKTLLERKGTGPYHRCTIPWALGTVLPDGTVTPCLSYRLGNVRDAKYRVCDLLGGGRMTNFRSEIAACGTRLPVACHNCCFARVSTRGA